MTEVTERTPLYYTFGNHMHWVDMEWLWGYFVLPSSVRDMLHFCRETGARGNINFDAVGYEKMAVEAPEALAELREAIAAGTIEVVGASYGQPYGLFHGAESNIRHRVQGARAVRRLLGVWPKTFWEEEFDFFPQLPQMLAGAGFSHASLFFQWTWHTPEMPREDLPAVWWTGLDGSRLLAGTRNALNLHQWPEDFAALLASDVPRTMPAAGIVQWLELMPSPDWMCRSELMIPQLQALQARPEFEILLVTLPEYLDIAAAHAVERRYGLDDVFHGMSLGKNGDQMRRRSLAGERLLLTAEAVSVLAGFMGRPYPAWDVYPTWELEEAWRELMIGQHHDNDECEGLNGHIGIRSYERSAGLADHVRQRTMRTLADRTEGSAGRLVAFNPLGWSRDLVVTQPATGETGFVRDVPPFGYRAVATDRIEPAAKVDVVETETGIALRRGSLEVTVDRAQGLITQIVTDAFPEGALRVDAPLGLFQMTRNSEIDAFAVASVQVVETGGQPQLRIERRGRDGALLSLAVALDPLSDALDLSIESVELPRPDPGMNPSLQWTLAANVPSFELRHDHPYGITPIRAEGSFIKKYPTGDWMTSPQWFETVVNPFTALSLLDFDGGDRGLLVLHDGSEALLRRVDAVQQVLTMYDPWDERYFVDSLSARFRIVPHGPLMDSDRWRMAQEFLNPALTVVAETTEGDLPAQFSPLTCVGNGVALTALYRETGEGGMHLAADAAAGIDYPLVARVVELDGQPATALLRVAGQVVTARKASLRRDDLGELAVRTDPERGWSEIDLALRPHEIATVVLDVVEARKVNRDLDSHRKVWATIHRQAEHVSQGQTPVLARPIIAMPRAAP